LGVNIITFDHPASKMPYLLLRAGLQIQPENTNFFTKSGIYTSKVSHHSRCSYFCNGSFNYSYYAERIICGKSRIIMLWPFPVSGQALKGSFFLGGKS